jgi:hypothetical protein
MKFEYKKETNLKIGQKMYGIIDVSIYTYDGVHPITVYEIDYNNDEVIFEVDQPCRYVACRFCEMEDFVFESKEEAENAESKLDFGVGLYAYSWY